MEATSPQVGKFQHVVDEIVYTENQYGEHLQVMLDHLVAPMQNVEWVSLEEVTTIFSTLEAIRICSQHLSEKLAVAKQSEESGKEVAQCFLDLDPYMKAYAVYIINQKKALKTAASVLKRGEMTLLLESKRDVMNRLGLKDYLVKPVQRLCRYPLLLGELEKAAGEDDREIIAKARKKVEASLDSINARKRDYDAHTRAQELAREVERLPPYLKDVWSSQVLLAEGNCSLVDEKGSHARHFFLFGGLVLYCKYRGQTTQRKLSLSFNKPPPVASIARWTYSVDVSLDGLQVVEGPEETSLKLKCSSDEEYAMVFSTPARRNTFMRILSLAIASYVPPPKTEEVPSTHPPARRRSRGVSDGGVRQLFRRNSSSSRLNVSPPLSPGPVLSSPGTPRKRVYSLSNFAKKLTPRGRRRGSSQPPPPDTGLVNSSDAGTSGPPSNTPSSPVPTSPRPRRNTPPPSPPSAASAAQARPIADILAAARARSASGSGSAASSPRLIKDMPGVRSRGNTPTHSPLADSRLRYSPSSPKKASKDRAVVRALEKEKTRLRRKIRQAGDGADVQVLQSRLEEVSAWALAPATLPAAERGALFAAGSAPTGDEGPKAGQSGTGNGSGGGTGSGDALDASWDSEEFAMSSGGEHHCPLGNFSLPTFENLSHLAPMTSPRSPTYSPRQRPRLPGVVHIETKAKEPVPSAEGKGKAPAEDDGVEQQQADLMAASSSNTMTISSHSDMRLDAADAILSALAATSPHDGGIPRLFVSPSEKSLLAELEMLENFSSCEEGSMFSSTMGHSTVDDTEMS